MSKFKWMPILRTGTFTDKNKQTVTIAQNDIDKIISSTDITTEPQFVIEHPKEDSIGFGTISQLKRVGDYLFALPKEVNEKFKAIVNSGKLPGRSVTLDKNSFSLKNISFLPPEIPPAVDGLGSYAFSSEVKEDDLSLAILLSGEEAHFADIETNNFEFAQYEVSSYPFRSIQTLLRNVKNLLIDKFGLATADNALPEYSLNDIGNPPTIFTKPDLNTGASVNPSFSSNQGDKNMFKVDLSKIDLSKVDPSIKAAFEAMQNQVVTLETNLSTKDVELQAATTKLSTAERTQLRNEVLQFCECDEVKLKIKPADKEKTVNFLMAQKEKGVIEFAAPDNPKTKIQVDAFDYAKGLIKNLPDVIELSELATNKSGSQQQPGYLKQAKEIADFVNR